MYRFSLKEFVFAAITWFILMSLKFLQHNLRFGAPRLLCTSLHGYTGRGAGTPADEAGEARQQAGQSSGQRGLSRRWSVVGTEASALDWRAP